MIYISYPSEFFISEDIYPFDSDCYKSGNMWIDNEEFFLILLKIGKKNYFKY